MTVENRYIKSIAKHLDNNNIAYEIDGRCINILNSSSMTRIIVKKSNPPFDDFCDVAIEEFNEFGNTSYFKYFASWSGKAFIKRLTKNIG